MAAFLYAASVPPPNQALKKINAGKVLLVSSFKTFHCAYLKKLLLNLRIWVLLLLLD